VHGSVVAEDLLIERNKAARPTLGRKVERWKAYFLLPQELASTYHQPGTPRAATSTCHTGLEHRVRADAFLLRRDCGRPRALLFSRRAWLAKPVLRCAVRADAGRRGGLKSGTPVCFGRSPLDAPR
jgi:hypothetical protein